MVNLGRDQYWCLRFFRILERGNKLGVAEEIKIAERPCIDDEISTLCEIVTLRSF